MRRTPVAGKRSRILLLEDWRHFNGIGNELAQLLQRNAQDVEEGEGDKSFGRCQLMPC